MATDALLVRMMMMMLNSQVCASCLYLLLLEVDKFVDVLYVCIEHI